MPVFKDENKGTWYVMARYVDWTGERKQKCKRGFATKREAQEWERMFQLKSAADMDMSFEAFVELYEKDLRPRLKENTWNSKEHINTLTYKLNVNAGRLLDEYHIQYSSSRNHNDRKVKFHYEQTE